MQSSTHTFYPLRYNTDKYSTLESQILQLRRDFQNKNQNNPYSLELLRPSLPPKAQQYKQPKIRLSSSREKIRQSSYEHDYAKTLQKKDKKIRQLLKEVLHLAEVINENQISMALSQKTQHKLNLLDDSVLQQQYNKLKDKLHHIKQSPLMHRLQISHISNHGVRNPQHSCEKLSNKPKLQLKHVIDIKVPVSFKNTSQSFERRSLHKMRQVVLNANVKPEGLKLQQMDVLSKKIQHYRHKLSNAESTIGQLLHNNQKISRVNEEINSQNVALRSQLLNYKYSTIH